MFFKTKMTSSFESDICFILEGTYPYVTGGVSAWVHDLITRLPEFTFSLVVILPSAQQRKMKYRLPANVRHIHPIYLQDKQLFKKMCFRKMFSESIYQKIWKFLRECEASGSSQTITPCQHEIFKEMVCRLSNESWNPPSILSSKKIWNLALQLYHYYDVQTSFLDYFWTCRFLFASILQTMNGPIPQCRIYHTVSTGYAGLYGTRASILTQRPLIITEHGIYSKERKIEITRSNWIYEKGNHRSSAESTSNILKKLWIQSFRMMSGLCYLQAQEIITLYEGNQRLQMEDGAPQHKLKIIPNGVDYQTLSQIEIKKTNKPIVGFIGRVVPIKDVKTFIRAFSLVHQQFPQAEAWIMGPPDEENLYFEECRALVNSLDLSDVIIFKGKVDPYEYYPLLDVLVLTSISEGQPLVILESQSFAIPVVSTDVGGCSELLNGKKEDEHLGPSGILTKLGSPEETAKAIESLLENPSWASQLGATGQKRVKLYYDIHSLQQQYKALYSRYQHGRNRIQIKENR